MEVNTLSNNSNNDSIEDINSQLLFSLESLKIIIKLKRKGI